MHRLGLQWLTGSVKKENRIGSRLTDRTNDIALAEGSSARKKVASPAGPSPVSKPVLPPRSPVRFTPQSPRISLALPPRSPAQIVCPQTPVPLDDGPELTSSAELLGLGPRTSPCSPSAGPVPRAVSELQTPPKTKLPPAATPPALPMRDHSPLDARMQHAVGKACDMLSQIHHIIAAVPTPSRSTSSNDKKVELARFPAHRD